MEVVCKEHEGVACCCVPIPHTPQLVWVILASLGRVHADDLITAKTIRSIDFPGLYHVPSNYHVKSIIIVGGGGFAREVAAWVASTPNGDAEIAGFLDDNTSALDGFASPYPLLGQVKEWLPKDGERFALAVGYPAVKRKVVAQLKEKGAVFTSIVHPTAFLGFDVTIGEGCCIGPYTVLSGYNRVGDFASVYFHSSLDHDVEIGEYCQISAHCDLTGGVKLGSDVFVGSSACIIPRVKVGAGSCIGAGAVVTRDVPSCVTVAGVPARVIKRSPL